MAVRVFDGTNDSISLNNNVNLTGAFTIAVMVKRAINTAYHAVFANHNSGGTAILTIEIASQAVGLSRPLLDISGTSSNPTTMTVLAADGWVLLVVTKGSGSVLPRFHKYVVSTTTWTHENGGNSVANAASHSGGTTRLGEYQGSDWHNGKEALVLATAGTAYSDAQCEALATNLNVSDWTGHAVTPSRVWRPGDVTVTDLLGAGDTATVNGGASIDAGDDPAGWTLSAGTSATVTAVPATALADAPVGRAFAAIPPLNTDPPVLTGTPEVGETLTVTDGTWDGDPAPVITYRWCRGLDPFDTSPEAFYPAGESTVWEYISGATSNTYVLTSADLDVYVFCGLLGTNLEGTYDVASNNAGPVESNVTDATVTAVPATAVADAPVGGAAVTANATVVAVIAQALADAPLGVVSATAAGTVAGVPATALASAPPANQLISSVVNAPATTILASAPAGVASTVGDATVTGVPATALADAPSAVASAGAGVTAVPSDATGAAPIGALSATATVGAVPSTAVAQAPRPQITPAPSGSGTLTTLTTTFAEDFA